MSEEASAEDCLDVGDALSSSAAVRTATSADAWLRAMVEFEVALALAGMEAGCLSGESAHVIARRLSATGLGAAELDARGVLAEAVATGTPVVPLLRRLRAVLPGEVRGDLHVGATSQDVVDTSLMLLLARSSRLVLADAAAVSGACAVLA